MQMNESRMIMTSGYPEMTEMIHRLAKELQYNVTVVEGVLDEAVEPVQELLANGSYDVVISRAGTAKMLANVVNVPLIYSESSDFDLIQSFLQAKKEGENICYINFEEPGFQFNFEKIEAMIGFNVTLLPYTTQETLLAQIEVAKEMGMDVIVGGGIRVKQLASDYGMKSMHIITSERTIRRSFLRAKQAAENSYTIKENTERLNAVVHVSEEGIFYLNKQKEIEVCNPAAERIFGVKAHLLLKKQPQQITCKPLRTLLEKEDLYIGQGRMTFEKLLVQHEAVFVNGLRVGTVVTCQEIHQIQELESKIRRDLHKKGLVAKVSLADIQYKGEKMNDIVQLAEQYAAANSTVLIYGESGTGKELVAQGIHNASSRKDGPFVAINCAALPETLLESELFGYVEGAFTGAKKGGRQGVFELAHKGTIFLDEIGEMEPNLQARLLRVLQEKEVMRLGGDRMVPVDIRVVAATNKNLWELVNEGAFRSDLYFRIGVLRLELPALRERQEDIPVLVDYLLQQRQERITWKHLSKQLQEFLQSYHWPGNIRQLENVLERLAIRLKYSTNESAFMKDVLNETGGESEQENRQQGDVVLDEGSMDQMERQIIDWMLSKYKQNRTVVAEKLKISRTTLWKKLNEPHE